MTCPTVTEIVIIRAPTMDRICVQTRPLNDEQREAAQRDGWQVWRLVAEVEEDTLLLRDGRDVFAVESVLP